MRFLREILVRRVLPPIMLRLYRLAGATWRYTTHDEAHLAAVLASGKPLVGAFLHARTFQLLRYFSQGGRGRWVLMCSQSRDGDAMAYVEQRLGFQVVRGSSGKGGARALVSLIKLQRNDTGLSAGLAIDGSRGPRGVAQSGGLILAQKTGGLVVPIAASTADGRIYTRSWDRIVIPRLFAHIHVQVGEPIAVPADADEAAIEGLRQQLEQAVHALHQELDRRSGFKDPEPLKVVNA